jgi:hypothetical protein
MRRQPNGGAFHIEDIQDQVELSLMRSGEHEVARAYVGRVLVVQQCWQIAGLRTMRHTCWKPAVRVAMLTTASAKDPAIGCHSNALAFLLSPCIGCSQGRSSSGHDDDQDTEP